MRKQFARRVESKEPAKGIKETIVSRLGFKRFSQPRQESNSLQDIYRSLKIKDIRDVRSYFITEPEKPKFSGSIKAHDIMAQIETRGLIGKGTIYVMRGEVNGFIPLHKKYNPSELGVIATNLRETLRSHELGKQTIGIKKIGISPKMGASQFARFIRKVKPSAT